MNRRMVIKSLGRMCMLESVFLLIPVVVGLIYRNSSIYAFLISAAISFIFGLIMDLISNPGNRTIYSKEGFVICSFTWILMSFFGSLPFVISGEIPSFFDAFFETVSGFTTTGATVINNIENLSEALIFWRSFTHFLGGMGVLVFMTMLTSDRKDRNMHILRAEMPGPIIDKFVPRARDTAKILYIIYIVIAFIQFLFLAFGDMSIFQAIIYTLSTAGTGGFASLGDSMTSFSSYSQWVVTVFMLLFGINFNVYFLITIKKIGVAVKSTELWVFLTIFFASSCIIACNIRYMYSTVGETIRDAAFQVSSIMTTTGFTTTDFNKWPELSKTILLMLMFCGACAGSTAGGFKISRIVIVFKSLWREISKMLHPRTVKVIKFEGKKLNEDTIKGVNVYLGAYFLCAFVIFFLLGFDKYDFGTNIVLTMSTFNNVGPAMGALSAYDSMSSLSNFSKIILSVSMLLGRLEIFPLMISIMPTTWSKKFN